MLPPRSTPFQDLHPSTGTRSIDQLRRAVHTLRLEARSRVRQFPRIIKPKQISSPGFQGLDHREVISAIHSPCGRPVPSAREYERSLAASAEPKAQNSTRRFEAALPPAVPLPRQTKCEVQHFQIGRVTSSRKECGLAHAARQNQTSPEHHSLLVSSQGARQYRKLGNCRNN